ncbi:hypothetical protein ACFLSE_09830 [Bacteroidota bacterium]
MENKFWSSDKMIGMVAFVISIGTLFTIIYQTKLIRKQQYASVLPYLEISSDVSDGNYYYLTLSNNGVGPAFLNDIKVIYNDTTYNMNPSKFVQQINIPCNLNNFIDKGKLLPADTKIMLTGTDNSESIKALYELFFNKKAIVEVTYSSIYNEKWIVRSGTPPVKIED